MDMAGNNSTGLEILSSNGNLTARKKRPERQTPAAMASDALVGLQCEASNLGKTLSISFARMRGRLPARREAQNLQQRINEAHQMSEPRVLKENLVRAS